MSSVIKKKKLLLIQSTPYDQKKQPIKKKKLYFVGLGLPLIAALTPEDWEVEIIMETIEDIPFDTEADLIGIGGMGHAIVRSIDIAKQFKTLGKTVVMGGYMVSLMPEEASKYCDAVLVGDAEDIWQEVLRDYEKGQLKSIYEKKLLQLSPPSPRFDLILNKAIGDFLPVQAGRGCPNTCSFCSVYCLYKNQYLKRPLEEVVRDIKQIKDLGFNKFLLLDDNIYSDPSYLKKLCQEIRALNMEWLSQCAIEIGKDHAMLDLIAKSGCIALSFGLESITQESLDGMDKSWAQVAQYPSLIKNIQSYGIDVSTEMVVGADGDTLDSIEKTADFIRDNKIVVPRFYILTPIPGTLFYDQMKEAGRIVVEDMYAYDGSQAVHQPLNMTPDQLTHAYWQLYNKVFTLSSILSRTLWRRDFFKNWRRYLFYFGVNLFYRHQIKQGITPNII